jgi:hypothetical protein
MGYTTEFRGRFKLDRRLAPEHAAYLKAFSETRRMKRDPARAAALHDPIRESAQLPIGIDGGYFVGGTGFMGQGDDPSVVDHNDEPRGQPCLWCKWGPTDDGMGIEWTQCEKFYYYADWLEYIVAHFLKPWGYVLNGAVTWRGESSSDRGTLRVKDNEIVKTAKTESGYARRSYGDWR